ncbi:MAG: GNAT family N-acetyltransferase [Deltaproteobacteria bacterium]|nr:MAG: GNAT family N-acetyltransferase [Deltaproteobacteria bacterium]
MKKSFKIEKAGPGDLQAILEVMKPWNMHHVPSPEMEELDLNCFFLARVDDKIIGAAGYKLLSQTQAKTTLLGVLPEYNAMGIGHALHKTRLEAMFRVGVKKVVTNADRPATINWYKKHYGYRKVGTLKKLCSFGDPEIDSWTTLELDLETYMRRAHRNEATAAYIARNEAHPLAPYPPLLINVCLTGMIPTKEDTQFVPVTTEEIVDDAIKVYDAGARIVHIHARDKSGEPTWKASAFEPILIAVRRERPGIICSVTTSGRNWSEFERRSEVLALTDNAKPDFASLTLGSLNFPTGPTVNSIDMIRRLAQTMKEKGIRPELEAFDLGMIGMAKYLERDGLIEGIKYFNLLFGNLGTVPATIGNLADLVHALPENSVWTAAGMGIFQLPMNVAAIVAGGGVRVGIEDSVYYDYNKIQLTTNEDLVRRVVRIAEELQRPIATPEEARRLLGLE